MDNVDEYLRIKTPKYQQKSEETTVGLPYDRNISSFRSSTTTKEISWGDVHVEEKKVIHKENFE
ncbi:MAG: hypothetical protein E7077_01460 [Bacteroidales bacterium]|jgi:hypothetical protein|nr:hypothetical protein [Bacteroidales bacterium]